MSIVGPVGNDFTETHMAALLKRGSNVDDVQRIEDGETFRPELSPASRACDVLFLANIQPSIQLQVREQCDGARFTALDSMNLWIDIAAGGSRVEAA